MRAISDHRLMPLFSYKSFRMLSYCIEKTLPPHSKPFVSSYSPTQTHHVFSTPRRQLFESIDQASSKLTLSHHSQLALSPNLKSYSPAVKLPYLLIHVANRNPSRRSERRESIPTVKAASFPPLMQYLPAGEFECGLASQSEGVTFARFGEA